MKFIKSPPGTENAPEATPWFLEHKSDRKSFPQMTTELVTHVGVIPQVVYYPGSSNDHTIADAFIAEGARVINADINEESVAELKNLGYEAYTADMHTFELDEKANVVVIFNAGYMTQAELEKVATPEALIIVNNYYNAASFMYKECPDFQLIAAHTNAEIVTDTRLEMPHDDQLTKDSIWFSADTIFAFQRQTGV